MLDLKNKLVIVTGASRGIGKAIAVALGNLGATVVGTATSQTGAAAISKYLSDTNIQGNGEVLDVASLENCTSIVKKVNDIYGPANILINNAGITGDNLLMRLKDDDWSNIINTNLTSVYRMSKNVLRGMTKARWGRIINIGSVISSMGNPGQTSYAASKSGIEGFTRSLAKEVGARDITVNTIAPGFIETDMTQTLTEDHRKHILQSIPLTRIGKPQDIANAVVFLSSDMASYITGETLHINGGMYM